MTKIEKFNKEYNLENFNTKWFQKTHVSNEEKKINKNTIPGKPTKIWKDITKRFFKNKWNIFFIFTLSLVVLLIAFGGVMSKYSSTDAVSNVSIDGIKYLRPTNVPLSVTGELSDLKNAININIDVQGDHLVGMGEFANHIKSSTFHANPSGTGVWTMTYTRIAHVRTLLGTDEVGISVFARLVSSTRYSIGLAVLVTTIESIIGTIIGLYLGYNAGKFLDTYFMRVIEVFTVVPALLVISILVLIFGQTFWSMVLALILIGWVGPVYVARMFTIKVKDSEFIKASQSLGASQNRIIFRHILPNIIGRVTVGFVHRIPSIIFIESTLIFLGIPVGGDAKNTLGNMLSQSRSIDAMTANPFYLLAPALVILTFTLSLQIIANGLRDAFDAKVSS